MANEAVKKIMISADDFGISRLASGNIIELVRAGKIDRVEIMMSENITDNEAGELLRSGVKLDIHLHLVGDKLDKWQTEKRKIVSGVAGRIIKFLFSYFTKRANSLKVKMDWEGQILAFKEKFGSVPDGVSSHEYVHFFPPYFGIILELSQKYNIPYIRFGKRASGLPSKTALILSWLRKINRKKFESSRMDTSEVMLSYDWIKNPEEFFGKNEIREPTEVICHPEIKEEYDFFLTFDRLINF